MTQVSVFDLSIGANTGTVPEIRPCLLSFTSLQINHFLIALSLHAHALKRSYGRLMKRIRVVLKLLPHPLH